MPSDSSSGGVPVPGLEKGRRNERSDAPPSRDASQPRDASRRRVRCNALLLSFASFWAIGFGAWVVTAGARYREEYARGMEGWRVGGTRSVELTLVKEDQSKLACASDQVIAGLRCGYRSSSQAAGALSPDDPLLLQPYNTVGNELLLGAGLWKAPDLKGSLPQTRFTAVCNYHVKGVMKSASIRFDATAPFASLGKSVPVGTLTDCVLPK